jgi:polyisoprenoid-binding protein YceI
MKITFKLLAILLVTAAIAVSCGSGSEDAQAEVGQAQEVAAETGTAYAVNTAESIINWKGEKFNRDFHTGTIKVKDGSLSVEGGNITAGSFTIDMTSIAVTDETPEDKKGYLIAHLTGTSGDETKDGDFFQTAKYPTAKFEITKVEALEGVEGKTHKISGNLTMLDITKEITFDANVAMADGKLTATTDNFTFDRTLWGIKFMSTLSGFVKEKALKDDIAISINLVAAE